MPRHPLLRLAPSTLVAALAACVLALSACADAPEPSPDAEADAAADTAATDTTAAVPGDVAALDSPYVTTPVEAGFAELHRVTLPPGASLARHRGGARVIYSLDGYDLRFTTGDLDTTRTFASSALHYHEAGVHAVANAEGDSAAFVVFERLPSTPVPGDVGAPLLDDMTLPDGARDDVLLENDAVKVHRVTLDPGAALPEHAGYARLIYAESAYTLTFTTPDGEETSASYAVGDAHAHAAGRHAVANTGDTQATYLVVAFKE